MEMSVSASRPDCFISCKEHRNLKDKTLNGLRIWSGIFGKEAFSAADGINPQLLQENNNWE
jgi:hypothetical protein